MLLGSRTYATESPRYFRAVIASEAKQSIATQKRRMDCFVASAPWRKRFAFVAGNDGQ